jgi:hypothetical protein
MYAALFFFREKIMKRTLKVLRLTIGLCLLPFVFAVYLLDRIASGILAPNYAHPAFTMWCQPKYGLLGFLRITILTIISAVIWMLL